MIFLGADHAGFELKQAIKIYLRELGRAVTDEGAFSYDESDDYPDFVEIVAKQVASGEADDRGLIFGASGQGEAMAANRFSRARAAVYCAPNLEIIKLSREHNDANILSIGARFVGITEAKAAVKLWLATDFSGEERHIRRLKKIEGEIQPEFKM